MVKSTDSQARVPGIKAQFCKEMWAQNDHVEREVIWPRFLIAWWERERAEREREREREMLSGGWGRRRIQARLEAGL
jgi:hypothetical protein